MNRKLYLFKPDLIAIDGYCSFLGVKQKRRDLIKRKIMENVF